eukprot:s2458_g4.t1
MRSPQLQKLSCEFWGCYRGPVHFLTSFTHAKISHSTFGYGQLAMGQSGPEQLQTDLCKLAAQRETLPKDAFSQDNTIPWPGFIGAMINAKPGI